MRNLNLIPFGKPTIVNGKMDWDEIIDNIIIFIPAGLYLNLWKKDWKIAKKIGLIASISLTLEVLQYLLAIGATDITDLISNTFGGILGLGICQMFYKIGKNEEKTIRILNTLGVVGTSLVAIFLGLLMVIN